MGHLSKLKTLAGSKFFKNILAMVSGTTLAQLLPLAVSPFLTRYYTEADFGIMGTITSITDIIAVAICGRYQLAIMLPKSSQKAFSLSILSILIAIIGSVFIFIIVIAFPGELENIIGVTGISKWLIYIPFAVFAIGLWNTLNIWVSRAANFKINATSKVLQGIGTSSISLLLSSLTKLYIGAGGLILGRISGLAGSILNMLRFYLSDIKKSSLKVNPHEIKTVAKKYNHYPKYNLIPALLNTFSTNALFLFLGRFYSIEDVGFYSLTNLVLLAPVALISTSIRDVLYHQFTKIVNLNQSPDKFYISSSLFLLIIGSPIFFIPLVAGPEMFSFVFGSKWIISGQFAAILSATYWIKLVVRPMSSIFNSINKIGIASIWQTTYAITTITLLTIVVIIDLDINTLLMVYAVHEIILYGIYYLLGLYYAKRHVA